MRGTCYLAGQITGLSWEVAKEGWRYKFKRLMETGVHGGSQTIVDCISPMRGKLRPVGGGVMGSEGDSLGQAIATNKAILTRDYNDVSRCNVMVANLVGMTTVSIGTCCELGFAHANRIPVVLIMEKDGTNPHQHCFVTEIAGYWTESLSEAVTLVRHIIGGGL